MQPIDYTQAMVEATERMAHGGVFLSVGGETPNTMTIGWGSIGFYWGKPVFTVVVRPSRHSYEPLIQNGEFTVSVPTHDDLQPLLTFAGRNSGRDLNKFDGHGLTAAPAQKVGAPIIAECGLHFECKLLLQQDMTPNRMDADVQKRAYADGDYHTMFFGEIVACYRT